MSDNDKEPQTWANMSALNKATFIAQLMAPLALLTTVVFSYFSWAEARRSAEVQQDMFAAQFAPKLDVTRALFGFGDEGAIVHLVADNIGGSAAYSVCLETFVGIDQTGLAFSNTCDASRT